MKGLVFDTENRIQLKDFGEPLLDNLQKEVGGYIEVVHPRYLPEGLCMVVDDEGLLKGSPVNNIASILYGTPEHGQRQSQYTCQTGDGGNGVLHGMKGDPVLGTGTAWTQSLTGVVNAVLEVKEIIDKVGIYLHHKCKKQTKKCRQHLEVGGADSVCIGVGKTNHYGNSCARECFGACSDAPGLEGISGNMGGHGCHGNARFFLFLLQK